MTIETPISIVVVDDHPLFRKGVADLIGMDPQLALIGEAASGEEGLKLALEITPDIVLLDLNMRGMDGLATLKALKEQGYGGYVVMLTVSDSESDIIDALRSGADGYLLKDMEPEDVLESIRAAASGQIAIPVELTQLLARALRHEGRPVTSSEANLTEREQQILELIAESLSNKQIARQLDIAESTVKVHVKHLLKKLKLRTRLEAAVWSIKQAGEG
ncbi:MAG: two-component system response regulator NarL [Pseudomonadota bacterium]